MKYSNQRIVSYAAALVLLLLLSTGTALAQFSVNWSAPSCPTAGRLETFLYPRPGGGQVAVTVPDSELGQMLCPREDTDGCCDELVFAGLLPGEVVKGWIKLDYVYTTKVGPCAPGVADRETIYFLNPVQAVAGPTGIVKFKVCYPFAHSWKSYELHVDFTFGLYPDAIAALNPELRYPWFGVPGLGWFGPSEAQGKPDYDPICWHLGCTPGYWKNHPEDWVGVGTGELFTNVFSQACNGPYTIPVTQWNEGLTMLEAAGLGGGQERAMIRHCSAAYVAAMWMDAQPSFDQGVCIAFTVTPNACAIVQAVQTAYMAGTNAAFEAAHQFCANLNENAVCPLNGVWLTTNTGTSWCDPGVIPCNPEAK